MKARSTLTREGENICVFLTDDVGLIFKTVTSQGSTTVNKTVDKPETVTVPPPGSKVEQYYKIETTAKYRGKIEIRIIYEVSNMTQKARKRQLMQWEERQWVNITTRSYPKYHLVIGETSHISIFAVT